MRKKGAMAIANEPVRCNCCSMSGHRRKTDKRISCIDTSGFWSCSITRSLDLQYKIVRQRSELLYQRIHFDTNNLTPCKTMILRLAPPNHPNPFFHPPSFRPNSLSPSGEDIDCLTSLTELPDRYLTPSAVDITTENKQ